MTTVTSLYRRIGAHEFPATDTDETTLASLDPAQDIVLGLLAAALNDEITPRWADATAGIPSLTGTSPVQSTHPFPASTEFLQARKVAFPALFCIRQRSEWSDWSLEKQQVRSDWIVDYVLGAFTPGSHRKLANVLPYALSVMATTLHIGGHKAYETHPSNANVPRLVLWTGTNSGLAQFSEVKVIDGEHHTDARFSEEDAANYYASRVRFRTVELYDTRTGHGGSFDAVDWKFHVSGDGGTINDLIRAASDVPYQDG